MDKFLSTGEMIDQLKVGGVAESEQMSSFDNFIYRVKKVKSGSIMNLDSNLVPTGHYTPLQGDIVNLKWRIQPNYVSFEEAMKALKEGKEVDLHIKGHVDMFINKTLYDKPIEELMVSGYSFKELIEGKWSIGNDNQ